MNANGTKTISDARTKRKLKAEDKRCRGAAAGKAWASSAHYLDLFQFAIKVGVKCDHYRRDLWKLIESFPELEQYRSEGVDFLRSFNSAVREALRVRGRVCAIQIVIQGFNDGVRWANEFADSESLARLEALVRADESCVPLGLNWPYSRLISRWGSLVVFGLLHRELSPADCVSTIMMFMGNEREDFWGPFFDDLSPKSRLLLARSNREIASSGYDDRHYIEGFIAGALSQAECIGSEIL